MKRFLAIAAYRITRLSDTPLFYTFALLLDELGGTLTTMDKDEQVDSFLEVEPAELLVLADKLDHLGEQFSNEINTNWGTWGRFRAVILRRLRGIASINSSATQIYLPGCMPGILML